MYVEFDTQNDLVNGYHIQASIEIENKNAKYQLQHILEDGDSSYVYKVIDGKIVKQNIKINSKSDDYAVLNSGLGQNDVIIKYPTEDMKEGDEVMVDSINESSSHVGRRYIILNSLIKLENIQKYYKVGKDRLHVLKSINLDIKKGEFIMIMGKSGSGKTTLLNILGFLDKFDKEVIYSIMKI